jgi:hypothetical protein
LISFTSCHEIKNQMNLQTDIFKTFFSNFEEHKITDYFQFLDISKLIQFKTNLIN